MTWLSRFIVNPSDKQLLTCYQWHQFVWRLFPNRERNDRPFVFRFDTKANDTTVTIISTVAPTPLPEFVERQAHQWNAIELPEQFFKHPYYRFSLRANATERDKEKDTYGGRSRKGRRFVITTPEKQRDWFVRQGERHGFEIYERSDALFEAGPREDFWLENKGLLVATHFRGVLKITDSSAFQQAVEQGLGRGKGFGLGLLMIQPVAL